MTWLLVSALRTPSSRSSFGSAVVGLYGLGSCNGEGSRQLASARSRASAAEGVVATRPCLIRIASRRSVGDRRANRAYHAQAPEKGAHGRQRPGDEARKAGTNHRHSEQGTAGRGGEGMLVGLKRSPALLDEGRAQPRDGCPRPRATAGDPSARPAIAGVHLTVGAHPSVLPRAFQEDLPAVGEVVFEQLLHLGGEAGIFRNQVDLPVGKQAGYVEVRRAHLRPPSVGHHRFGVDHRAAVLEDAHARLEELPVAGARGPANPGYVVGRRSEDPNVHAVPGGRHQGLGKYWHGEEVRVGDPEPLLHPGREQLQHAQGAHPARFLDDHAHGLFPRHLDVSRAGTLVVRQLLHRLVPHAREGAIYVGHRRPPHADRRVPVGQPRLLRANHPAVGDAHASRRGVLTVYGEQLAVVAPDRPERRARSGWVDRPNLHARLPEATPEGTRHVEATEPVVEYPHPHAIRRLRRQRVDEPMADLVVLEDVVVEMDPPPRTPYGREPIFVGVRAVLEQHETITFPQRRVTGARQGTFDPSAPRRRGAVARPLVSIYILIA